MKYRAYRRVRWRNGSCALSLLARPINRSQFEMDDGMEYFCSTRSTFRCIAVSSRNPTNDVLRRVSPENIRACTGRLTYTYARTRENGVRAGFRRYLKGFIEFTVRARWLLKFVARHEEKEYDSDAVHRPFPSTKVYTLTFFLIFRAKRRSLFTFVRTVSTVRFFLSLETFRPKRSRCTQRRARPTSWRNTGKTFQLESLSAS